MLKILLLVSSVLIQMMNTNQIRSKYENFSDNSLLITISNKESLKFKDYSISDFSKNGIIDIDDLTKNYKTNILNDKYEKKENFNRIYKLSIDTNKTNIFKMKNKLEKLDFIENVDFDFNTFVNASINDTYATSQWEISHLGLNNAWDISKGSNDIKVGVIDTGIDASHPDLSGKVNSTLSKSFIESSQGSALEDRNGHGTFVAGIIGANTNNNAYVAGVCWNVNLVSLKTQKIDNTGSTSNLAAAINYAKGNSIDILNMSVGTYGYSSALENAIDNYDGLIISSAGNNTNTDNVFHYPSGFDNSNIISVGASIYNDSIWVEYENNEIVEGSNYGKNTVDIFAPGGDIIGLGSTSVFSNGIATGSGTSFAAPYVTGVAVLIKAKYPSLTPLQIKNRILDNCVSSSFLSNYCGTGGVLHANYALTNQLHSHACSYVQYNNTYHIKRCNRCGGYNEYEAHTWVADETIVLGNNILEPNAIAGFKCYYCNAKKSTGLDL